MWTTIDSFDKMADALHHVKENPNGTYPLQIVRIEKTVVFSQK
jgi:hypothetical protein